MPVSMIEYKKAFSLLSEVGGTPPLFAAQQAKEALKESISAVSESFCCKLRLENRRNTLLACRKSPRRVIVRNERYGCAATTPAGSRNDKTIVF